MVLVVTALIAAAVGVSTIASLPPALDMLVDPWGYCAVFVGVAALCALRARREPAQRLAWAALGAGLLSYGTGNVVFALLLLQGPPPYPSLADAFWLAYFPLTYLGIVQMWRQRVHRFHLSMLLDGLVAALGVAALAWVVAYGPLIGISQGRTSVVVTNLAYPVADLLLVAVVVGGASALGQRSHRVLNLVVFGLLTFAVADMVYALQVAAGTYQPGGPLSMLWAVAALSTGIAAVCPSSDEAEPTRAAGRWRMIILPTLFAIVSLSLLAFGLFHPLSTGAGVLAIGSLVAAVLRASLAFRQVSTLAETRRQARTDDLTGLHNRRAFMADLERALQQRTRDESVGVLLIDLDRFKEVNDALGHHVGDALLQLVATRIAGCLESEAVLARLGGDEFAIMVPGLPNSDAAATLARLTLDQLRAPFQLPGITLHVGASVGIAMSPEHADDGATLLQQADVAMYDAKAHGGEFRFYSLERDVHSRDRLQIIEQLRASLDRKQLVLHYQPLVDLTTDTVVGVEALVRWNHPQLGVLSPDRFLPLAEQTGLMRPLCEYVLDEALAQLSRWRGLGLRLRMSVNVSTSNLLDARLPTTVAALLTAHDVPSDALVLEVTESTIMADPVRAQSVVERLDALGVRVAVDDYGTGYSSLAYLRDLAVQTLKLDRSFLKDLVDDPRAAAIVRSTTELAHALDMSIVAEGVEDQSAVLMLRRFGCDLAQGYLYSKPLPPAEFLEWLRAHAATPARLRALFAAN